MANTKTTKPAEAPKAVVPEKPAADFFRNNNSFNKNLQTKFKPQRDFTGFRRGSR